MPNRALGFRVPAAEYPAWARLVRLARDLGVNEAERRLRAVSRPDVAQRLRWVLGAAAGWVRRLGPRRARDTAPPCGR